MKNFQFPFCLLLLSTLIIFSCKKENETEPAINKENILNDNAFIIDTLDILSSTDNSFTMKKDTAIRLPKVGDIILTAPSTKCVNGMLRKILSVNEVSGNILCQTKQSNLNDAFKELHIASTYKDTFSSSAYLRTGSSLSINFTNNNDIVPGIKIDGKLIFDIPEVTFKYEKERGSLLPNYVLVKADFNCDGSTLEFTSTAATSISVSKKEIHTFDNMPPITVIIPIGGFPLPVKFKQKLILEVLPFDIMGKLKLQIIPEISATLGCKYENGNWQNLCTYSINASTPSIFSKADFLLYAGLSAELTIFKPRYEISPMYIDDLKCFFEIPNKLNLDIQGGQPNYSLKYNLDVTGGFEQTFWTGADQTFSITGNLIDKTIIEGSWSPDASFTVSNANISAGTTISFTQTSGFNPTSWQWNFPGGTPSTSTLTHPTVTYTTPGNYDVQLIATNAAGSDTLKKTGYIHVTNNLNDTLKYCYTGNAKSVCTVQTGSDPFGSGCKTRTCYYTYDGYYINIYYAGGNPTSGIVKSSTPGNNITSTEVVSTCPSGGVTGELPPICGCGSPLTTNQVTFTGNNFSSSDGTVTGYIDGDTVHINLNGTSFVMSRC